MTWANTLSAVGGAVITTGISFAGFNQTFTITNIQTGQRHQWRVEATSAIDPVNPQPTSSYHPECVAQIPINSWALVYGEDAGSEVKVRPLASFESEAIAATKVIEDSAKITGNKMNDFYPVTVQNTDDKWVNGWMHCSVLNSTGVN